jgi:NAD+ synthase
VSEIAADVGCWIREKVVEAGCTGAVFGLSGGLDSAVTAALCHQALGTNCLALIMPVRPSSQDEADALKVAGDIGVRSIVVYLGPVLSAVRGQLIPLASGSGDDRGRIAEANLAPRVRMILLYYYANLLGYLVVGTGNRSELEVGYFTKYGDGGVDILPLGSLVKRQVRDLANELGLPSRIIEKVPSAGLWEGQTDEGELGLTYAELDSYLLGEAGASGLPSQVVGRIEDLRLRNRHKLAPPPVWTPEA